MIRLFEMIIIGVMLIMLVACSKQVAQPNTGETTVLSEIMNTDASEQETSGKLYENQEWGYSFRYPSGALINEISREFPDSFLGTHYVHFGYGGVGYSIRGRVTYEHASIEQWLRRGPGTQKTFDLSEYNQITVGEIIAYDWKEGLVTTFMVGNVVFDISAFEDRDIVASRNLDDPVYRKLLESFKLTQLE